MANSNNSNNSLLGNISKTCKQLIDVLSFDAIEALVLFCQLNVWHLQAIARQLLNEKSLNCCCRSLINKKTTVDVLRSQRNTFGFGNLMRCGSIWKCPVCGRKVTQKKRTELHTGLHNLKQKGCGLTLMTVTSPHHANDSCKDLTNGMVDALRTFFNRERWKEFSRSFGVVYSIGNDNVASNRNLPQRVVGRIKAFEVTYSKSNGWHPHFHIMLITDKPIPDFDRQRLQIEFLLEWQSCCLAVGLNEPNEHGLSLVDGEGKENYLCKWGIEESSLFSIFREDHNKTSYTPFQLLMLHAEGDRFAGKLFQEYAKVYCGKRQFVYSKGLRAYMGLTAKKSDKTLAKETGTNSTIFATIPEDTWKKVFSQKQIGALIKACMAGETALENFLCKIIEKDTDIKAKYRIQQEEPVADSAIHSDSTNGQQCLLVDRKTDVVANFIRTANKQNEKPRGKLRCITAVIDLLPTMQASRNFPVEIKTPVSKLIQFLTNIKIVPHFQIRGPPLVELK